MIGPCHLGKTASIVHQDLAASAAIGLANLIVTALGQKGVAPEVARRVHLDGKTFLPSQAYNLYVFPAVGMAIGFGFRM
jgi:malic enzyme